jgi:hypothetical protein
VQDKEIEEVLKKIRFNRQMQKKHLYEQAKRANRKQENAPKKKTKLL